MGMNFRVGVANPDPQRVTTRAGASGVAFARYKLKRSAFLAYNPVEPKPPSPLTVSSKLSTSTICACSYLAITI